MNESSSDILEKEYSSYGVKAKTIAEIQDLQEYNHLRSLRIMHSDALISLQGTEQFSLLTELNISSNSIEVMDFMSNLNELKTLNLSGNKLKSIQGLSNLRKLEKLNLAHNKIVSFSGLQQIQGPNYALKHLDVRNNRVSELLELQYIGNLGNIQEVIIEVGRNTNPMCSNKIRYYQAFSTLKNFGQLNKIDGKSRESIYQFLKENSKDYYPSRDIAPSSLAHQQHQQTLGYQQQHTGDFGNNDNLHQQQQSQQQGLFSTNKRDGSERQMQQQQVHIKNLQEKLQEMVENQKEMVGKFEDQEKYWNDKCQQLQEEMNSSVNNYKIISQKNKQLSKEYNYISEQLLEFKEQNNKYDQKNEKKEIVIEQLQKRIADLVMHNGEYHREIQLKNQDVHRQAGEMVQLENRILEMKGNLKEAEKTIVELQKSSLENAQVSAKRNDSIQLKYDEVLLENKKIINENSQLQKRVQELLELCREWEYKYDKKLQEVNFERKSESKDLQLKTERQEQELKEKFEKMQQQKDQEFKENIDMLEEEFKNVLIDNNEKFKQLKQAYEQVSASEQEAKTMLKVTVERNNEYEKLLSELQENEIKLKKQNTELQEENTSKEHQSKVQKNELQQDLEINKEERNKYLHEKMALERQLADIQEEKITESLELERCRARLKQYEGIEGELEDLQTALMAKNKMLDDKNDSIEELRGQMEYLKRSEKECNEDYAKILKKYEKQNQIIDELDEQLRGMQEENDNKQREIQEKKNVIAIFEKEIGDVRDRQDKDITVLKDECKDKDGKIVNLLDILDECKEELRQKDNKIKEVQDLFDIQKIELGQKDDQYRLIIDQKNKEIEELTKKIIECQTDMEKLVEQIDKQKQEAAENIQRLSELFKK